MLRYSPEIGFLLCLFANAFLAFAVMCGCLLAAEALSAIALTLGSASVTAAGWLLAARTDGEGADGALTR